MKKTTFLLIFLFCLNTLPLVYAEESGVSLFDSAYDTELDDNVGTTENENATTFQPGDTKLTVNEAEDNITNETEVKAESVKTEATSNSGILSGKAYVNSTGYLNLRAKPTKKSKSLAKLYFNDEVNIIGHQSGWYQIDSPQNGWVMAEFVSGSLNNKVDNCDSSTISSGKGYVNCDGWLNLREKPTKKSKRLAKLYKNDEVNIIACNGKWYQIDSPQKGWVMTEFISVSKTGETTTTTTTTTTSTEGSEGTITPETSGNTETATMGTQPMGGSESSTYNAGSKGNGTTTLKTLNDTWTVINTPIGILDYAKHLQKTEVCQNSDEKKYGSSCLGFSYTHAWGLYNGNKSYTAADGGRSVGAGNFKTLIDDNKQYILNAVYLEIKAGRPCILHVNGNKQGTSRHFVTVVGFRSSVTSGETITEDDLLILDSWDAKIERMDQKNSRFMTSGKQCRKSYSGYRIQYMK